MASTMQVAQKVYFQDGDFKVLEPVKPLAPGAIEIQATANDADKIFDVYQKFRGYCIETYKSSGFFFLERTDTTGTIRQIIPYPQGKIGSFLTQVQVAWNLAFPKLAITWHGRHDQNGWTLTGALAKNTSTITQTAAYERGTDFACNDARIQAQLVLENDTVRLLKANKRKTKFHDLVTPKQHMQRFDKKHFIDAYTVATKRNDAYKAVGCPIHYITYADSKASGQTVPHAIMHSISVPNNADEYWGIAKTLRQIVVDSWLGLVLPKLFTVSDKQLQAEIQEERKLLPNAL